MFERLDSVSSGGASATGAGGGDGDLGLDLGFDWRDGFTSSATCSSSGVDCRGDSASSSSVVAYVDGRFGFRSSPAWAFCFA